MTSSVIPAKAGIQEQQALLDPGVRRGDGFDGFLRDRQTSSFARPYLIFIQLIGSGHWVSARGLH